MIVNIEMNIEEYRKQLRYYWRFLLFTVGIIDIMEINKNIKESCNIKENCSAPVNNNNSLNHN